MLISVNDGIPFTVSNRIGLKGSSPRKTKSWTRTGNVLLNKLVLQIGERAEVRALQNNSGLSADDRDLLPTDISKSSDKGVIFQKAKKCQALGGVWINDTCQIEID